MRQCTSTSSCAAALTAAAPRPVASPPARSASARRRRVDQRKAFAVLAFRPDLKDHPVYRASVAGSFVAASWCFMGLAAVAWKAWLGQR